MVSFKKKFYLFKVRDTWFRYQSGLSNLFTLQTYSFVQNPEKITTPLCIKSITHTVELPLLDDIDLIFSKFKTTVRQEVRKAEEAGVECLHKDDIEKFIPFYNDFAALKKLYPAQRNMILGIGENFKTSFAMLNGEILVAHSYIVDQELGITRLFQSASKRLDENFDKKIIGFANKLLTAKDIAHFKATGFKVMDFGGFAENTDNKSLKGINDFKLSFGGQKAACTNYHSVFYYVLKKLAEKLDKRY